MVIFVKKYVNLTVISYMIRILKKDMLHHVNKKLLKNSYVDVMLKLIAEFQQIFIMKMKGVLQRLPKFYNVDMR